MKHLYRIRKCISVVEHISSHHNDNPEGFRKGSAGGESTLWGEEPVSGSLMFWSQSQQP